MLHLPLLQLAAHDAGELVDRGLVDVCDLEFRRIELVTGAHAADDRRAGCLTGHDELDLRRHGIDRIDDIIILLEMEFRTGFRQEKALVTMDDAVRVDVMDALRHHLGFIAPDALVGGYDLTVDVREAYGVVIHEVDRADTGAREGFDGETTEDDDAGLLQSSNGFRSQQETGSRKLIWPRFSSFVRKS